MKNRVSPTLWVVVCLALVGALIALGLRVKFLIKKNFPDQAQALVDQAKARYDEGNYQESAWDAQRAIRLDPKKAEAYFRRAKARVALGDLDGAIEDQIRAIDLDAALEWAYVDRSDARIRKGDLDAAIADCDAAIKLDPKDSMAWNNRGYARSRKLDAQARHCDLDGAIEDYTEAIRVGPDTLHPYLNRADARLEKGDLHGAVEDHGEAIRLKPDAGWLYLDRAPLLEAQGDVDAALADYRKALDLGLERAARRESAQARLWIARRCPEAAKGLGRARAAMARFDYDAARKEFETVLQALAGEDAAPETRPVRAEAHYHLARILAVASGGRDGPMSPPHAIQATEAARLRGLAFEQLSKAIKLGLRDNDLYAKDKDLDPLHADARWKTLVDGIR